MRGRVLVVGAGVGKRQGLTEEARAALREAKSVVYAPELADLRAKLDPEIAVPWWPALAAEALDRIAEALAEGSPVVYLVPGSPARAIPGAVWHGLEQLAGTLCVISGDGEFANRAVSEVPGQAAPSAGRGQWPAARPLAGRRVLLLRQGEKAEAAAARLERTGATVLRAALTELADPPTWDPVDRALSRIGEFDWIVLTSAEAVRRFVGRLFARGGDVREMRAEMAVVGPETARELGRFGLRAALMPEASYSQRGLAAAFARVPVAGRRILLPGGQLNRPDLADSLAARGAEVESLVVYVNRPLGLPPAIGLQLREGKVDAVLFTAPSSVDYLMAQMAQGGWTWPVAPRLFCIGPSTSAALARYGLASAGEPERASIEGLADVAAAALSAEPTDRHL